ncbi:N-acetyl sugar amidotransferase [Alphaproteobacteria bacterium]|nr:N-acetyl sugar amidotransferase [Alphaproteobacteria bacterium]
MNKFTTLHGLPERVIFCKKCVMSNQRPATSVEFKKSKTSDTSTSSFGDDGICDACKYAKIKDEINWDEREKELEKLCNFYRKADGSYDVIVPGSGGKDSIFVAHLLKFKYGMNPLTVTWAPHSYTEIGKTNLEAWQQCGLDNILFTPNPVVHSKLTQQAFLKLVNPFQPFIIGQKLLAPKLAMKFGVDFIMYGENQSEAHNSIKGTESSLMDSSHYTRPNGDFFIAGLSGDELKEMGLSQADTEIYNPINKESLVQKKLEVHFMSFFTYWSPQQSYYYAKANSSFKSNPEGRSEGTYTKYSSLDDKIDGQHYFTSLIKFGQGRAMNDACRDIRDGLITREEGVELVNKYDTEFPAKYFNFFLNYAGISEEKYWDVINKARSPHLWEKSGNEWQLRHPCT